MIGIDVKFLKLAVILVIVSLFMLAYIPHEIRTAPLRNKIFSPYYIVFDGFFLDGHDYLVKYGTILNNLTPQQTQSVVPDAKSHREAKAKIFIALLSDHKCYYSFSTAYDYSSVKFYDVCLRSMGTIYNTEKDER